MNPSEPGDIERTLDDLMTVLGDALIIGGMAVIHHGYQRYTKDVDVLYAYRDGSILRRLSPHFKVVRKAANGWHHLAHRKTKVRLELIPEGGLTTYGFIPGPDIVGGEQGIVSLWGLVWLKLVSGRLQDDADIAELAKVHLPDLGPVRERLPLELRERFDSIMERAKREIDGYPNNHPQAPPPNPEAIREMAEKYGAAWRTGGREPGPGPA